MVFFQTSGEVNGIYSNNNNNNNNTMKIWGPPIPINTSGMTKVLIRGT